MDHRTTGASDSHGRQVAPDSGARPAVEVRSPVEAGAATVVVVSGELDLESAPTLRYQLDRALDEGTSRVVIDCTALEFCDSSGLNVLLGAQLRLQTGHGMIELAALRGSVARMFEITGTLSAFIVHASLEQALVSS